MLFSLIKILLFLTIVRLSSSVGYDDSVDSEYQYSMTEYNDNDELMEFEDDFKLSDIDNLNEQDRAVMKAVEEIANYEDPESKLFSSAEHDEYDYFSKFDLIHLIILVLALLLFVSFIIIFIQASKISVFNSQRILKF